MKWQIRFEKFQVGITRPEPRTTKTTNEQQAEAQPAFQYEAVSF